MESLANNIYSCFKNKGGDRNFATYDCFKYSLDDFKEKARVLKDGCFLVEMLPAENENNHEYLYQIKKFAEQCCLLYYSKVTLKKGDFVSNTGKIHQNGLPLGPLYSYPRIIAPL